ncbi:ribosomal protein L17 [Syntrophotalea carbinolica DSM 2380]|uniref:Large ribosomal subunit protein bL17 n=1 Tax=Syntrophotalea carbinolica (strain DSM 2380 / NBRC 103641 / GraBd1) TaxID=338963 RepID=RL17_SYNC1|nr:RecName: Full=Large ribosomal subunit protein bL17; AltName: Full=50S ribosomal protein L17 [Syntrophotalea carbinolica DSM 2380]ABA87988.1 ribosomal protein L17 [Syntrophotalea carbinolica DSM 2380]
MRHNKSGRRLGRNSSHRAAMMRNMVTSLLEHEKITTTDARAKELRKVVDRMITLGKRGDLHARRQAIKVIQDRKVVGKLFELIAPRYTDRPGGYTRIIKLGNRLGDNAPQVIIELVEEEFTPRVRKAADDKAVAESVATEVAEATEAAADTKQAE